MKRIAVAGIVLAIAVAVALGLLKPGAPALASGNSDPVGKVCSSRLALSLVGQTQLLPYCSSQSLDAADPRIGLLVVVIHDSSRTAERAMSAIQDAVLAAGARGRGTLIVAPQFLMDLDAVAHHLPNDVLRWRRLAGGADWEEGWDQGNDSDSATGAVSSFAALDALVEKVADGTRFPSLKRIVVAGLSLGAQLVNRYAASSQVEGRLLRARGIRTRYVVAAPSSYLYVDERRPTSGATTGFAVPSAAERSRCPGWNNYRYGLEALNPYMLSAGKESIRALYTTKEIAYLVGQEDTGGETSCAAQLQGANRLERARSYWGYLRSLFGDALANRQVLSIVPGVGHSWSLFTSRCALEYLFSDALPTACTP